MSNKGSQFTVSVMNNIMNDKKDHNIVNDIEQLGMLACYMYLQTLSTFMCRRGWQ